jgi:L-glyceraldehyde 3-phosphate reductase
MSLRRLYEGSGLGMINGMSHTPSDKRYEVPDAWFRRCGNTGLKLPSISFGLWQNFGESSSFENGRAMLLQAFDLGITYFDLSNNYGPPRGQAEITFGKILREDLAAYRDEILIATKAGYGMWNGPYGVGGSRKHIIACCEQSLKRLGVDYIDVFFSHLFDIGTPLEETMSAFDHLVRQGKALYLGFSTGYDLSRMAKVVPILRGLGSHGLIHMSRYSMFNRDAERGLHDFLAVEGVAEIAFSPLAEGALTDRYLSGMPADARAASRFENAQSYLGEEKLQIVQRLNELAKSRGQTLAQMALAWVLRRPVVASALIGASRPEQIRQNAAVLKAPPLNEEEINTIESILSGKPAASK